VVPPLGAAPTQVRRWFDDSSIVVDRAAYDDTLETARAMGKALPGWRRRKNTRRAYRAGVAA
jgi:hypothetical protein